MPKVDPSPSASSSLHEFPGYDETVSTSSLNGKQVEVINKSSENSKKWFSTAIVVGLLILGGTAAFGAVGLLHAHGVAFPQWIASATNTIGSNPHSIGLWALGTIGPFVGAVITGYGIYKLYKSGRTNEESEIDDRTKLMRELSSSKDEKAEIMNRARIEYEESGSIEAKKAFENAKIEYDKAFVMYSMEKWNFSFEDGSPCRTLPSQEDLEFKFIQLKGNNLQQEQKLWRCEICSKVGSVTIYSKPLRTAEKIFCEAFAKKVIQLSQKQHQNEEQFVNKWELETLIETEWVKLQNPQTFPGIYGAQYSVHENDDGTYIWITSNDKEYATKCLDDNELELCKKELDSLGAQEDGSLEYIN